MSERALKRLVGALVVVVGVWLLATFLSGGGGGIRATGAITDFFAGVDPDSVEVVRITARDRATELRRNGGAWTANGFDADMTPVVQLLNTLRLMDVGDLAAANPANHGRMGVSADSAVTLELEIAGGDARTILVGRQGPRFATAYARLPGEDEVYVLEGDLRTHLQRRPDDWRDKVVASVDTARVARIEVERDGASYAVVRGDSVWAFEDGGEVDGSQVRNILIELSSVAASGFLTEADSIFGLPRGGSTVAYDADGAALAELTVGEGDGERWLRAAGDSIVYRLSTFRVGRLAPPLESMRAGG